MARLKKTKSGRWIDAKTGKFVKSEVWQPYRDKLSEAGKKAAAGKVRINGRFLSENLVKAINKVREQTGEEKVKPGEDLKNEYPDIKTIKASIEGLDLVSWGKIFEGSAYANFAEKWRNGEKIRLIKPGGQVLEGIEALEYLRQAEQDGKAEFKRENPGAEKINTKLKSKWVIIDGQAFNVIDFDIDEDPFYFFDRS
jgi:hypothetical protein